VVRATCLIVLDCQGFVEGGESPSTPFVNMVGSELIIRRFGDDSVVLGLVSQPRVYMVCLVLPIVLL